MRLGVRLKGALVGESTRADAEAKSEHATRVGARDVAVERQYKQHAARIRAQESARIATLIRLEQAVETGFVIRGSEVRILPAH